MQNTSLEEENSESPSIDIPMHAKESSVFNVWLLELCAVLVAIATFFGLVGLLLPFRKERSQPEWPSAITLNTVISILTVIMRASLIYATAQSLSQQKWIWFRRPRYLNDLATFDSATRGAYGSLQLLLKSSLWNAATISGAMLMILALAIGPFARQIILSYKCYLPMQAGMATMPRQAMYRDRGRIGGGSRQISIEMMNAVYGGIYTPEASSIVGNCMSGNCSFTTPYKTLEICSSCEDISQQLIITSGHRTNDGNYAITEWSYTLPSGTQAIWYSNTDDESVQMISKYWPTLEYERDFFEVVWSAGSQSVLRNCTTNEQSDPSLFWQCQGYGAARCSINVCLNTYSANITNNHVNEITSDSPVIYEPAYENKTNPSLVDVSCLDDQQRQALISRGYHIDNTTHVLAVEDRFEDEGNYDSTVPQLTSATAGDNTVSSTRIPARCMYYMPDLVCFNLGQYIGEVLQGNVTFQGGAPRMGDALEKMYNESFTSFDVVSSLFRNVSDSVSKKLRMHGNNTANSFPPNVSDVIFAGNQPAFGIMIESHVCIQVRWWWLTYPAILIIITTILVISTMFSKFLTRNAVDLSNEEGIGNYMQSRRRPIDTWKSSILPYMFHGLDDRSVRIFDPAGLTTAQEMEDVAKRTKTQLTKAEDGWKFVKVD